MEAATTNKNGGTTCAGADGAGGAMRKLASVCAVILGVLIGLPGCTKETTEERAREIVLRLTADPISTLSGEIKISVCYGTAVSHDSVTLDKLIKAADEALYQQKRMK